jgi:ABC-type sugar transport system permease subunit
MNYEMGYASSIAFILAALVMIFSILNLKISRREE